MTVLLVGSVAQAGQSVVERELGGKIPVDAVMLNDPDKDAVAAKFAEARMIVSPAYRADFPPSPKLEMLHAPNAGLDSIEFDALPPGTRVCNVFEHHIGIGEYVLAGMLRSVIDLDARSRKFKDGLNWEDTPRLGAPTRGELSGKTLLSIGYGTIGQAVAERARPFGVRIEAVTRTPRPMTPEPDKMAGYDSMKQMIGDADFVLIACPLNDETEAMFDADLIGAMKPSAILINVARGKIVAEKPLYDALAQGRIGGAVLDTWWDYPSAENRNVKPSACPFWELDNVVMTPHCSGWTDGLIERRFKIVAENARRLFAGEDLINQVFPDV